MTQKGLIGAAWLGVALTVVNGLQTLISPASRAEKHGNAAAAWTNVINRIVRFERARRPPTLAVIEQNEDEVETLLHSAYAAERGLV